ncbi:MAG: hypothetical protein RLZZ157_1334, partial [Pseudomonadota bacterium]
MVKGQTGTESGTKSPKARNRKKDLSSPATAGEVAAKRSEGASAAKDTPSVSFADSSPVGRGSKSKTDSSAPATAGEVGAKRTEGASAPPPGQPNGLMDMLQAQNLDSLETLTKGLGLAAERLAAISGKLASYTLDDNARPFKADPYGLSPYAADVATRLAHAPEKMMLAQQELWLGYADIWMDAVKSMSGEKAPADAVQDKRFADPDWQNIPLFNILQKTYLHTAHWFTGLVDQVEGLDDMTRRKASFFTKQLADAFSPSNFLMTNPVALREALRTGGQSIIKGIANLEQDLDRGKGRLTPTQVDERPFKIGENIAVSPGKVIWRGEIIEIIQYDPTTETVFETPILFFPPWIN